MHTKLHREIQDNSYIVPIQFPKRAMEAQDIISKQQNKINKYIDRMMGRILLDANGVCQ